MTRRFIIRLAFLRRALYALAQVTSNLANAFDFSPPITYENSEVKTNGVLSIIKHIATSFDA